jgi:N-acetylmuramoyl-L-alanine amidase
MKIKNHKLEAEAKEIISFQKSPNTSGAFGSGQPDTIVIHYTAGGSLESSVRWLLKPEAKASAHLVVGKDGEIVQLVPFNTIAWHAGKSSWKGRSSLNRFSLGIEIDNAGILEKRVDGYYTYFGKKIAPENIVLATHKNKTSEMAWEAYTAEQIETVEAICLAIKAHYAITEIVGHEDIAPTRKTDPGPAFPLQKMAEKIMQGRKDDEGPTDEEEEAIDNGFAMVTADALNIRSQANGSASKVANPLPKGTVVKILKTEGNWSKVRRVTEGWVGSKWLKK